MKLLEIYNLIIHYLGLPVPERIVETIGLFGLILITYGAILLVKPLIKSNKEIEAISSYRNSGAILGMGHTIEVNEPLKRNLEEDRDKGFEGAMLIFVGFTLQLLVKSIEIVYPTTTMPNGINWLFFIILIIAFTIMCYGVIIKMKIKKHIYEIL